MRLLDGTQDEEGRKDTRNQEGEEEGPMEEVYQMMEEELGEEEIRQAMMKLKLKKAAGIDGIPMEAWRFAGAMVKKGLVDILQQIWKEGEIPGDWKKSVIVPLHKKGDVEKTGNYRGISLLCTAYKIYAEIIRQRLEEVERLKLLPESQGGFRRGRGTMDNVFVLDHLMQRTKMERGWEIVHTFRGFEGRF